MNLPDAFTFMVTMTLMTSSVRTNDVSHIPVGSSALASANKAAVRFTFSTIDSNIPTLLPQLNVKAHRYSVNSVGGMRLGLQSTKLQAPLLSSLELADQGFSCDYITPGAWAQFPIQGTVIKFLDSISKYPLPEEVPSQWMSGQFVVLRIITIGNFPIDRDIAMKCQIRRELLGIQVVVAANVTIRKVGCPRDKWGVNCDNPCACQNNGECHTFAGRCICPETTTGLQCETDITNTPPPVMTSEASIRDNVIAKSTLSTSRKTFLSTERKSSIPVLKSSNIITSTERTSSISVSTPKLTMSPTERTSSISVSTPKLTMSPTERKASISVSTPKLTMLPTERKASISVTTPKIAMSPTEMKASISVTTPKLTMSPTGRKASISVSTPKIAMSPTERKSSISVSTSGYTLLDTKSKSLLFNISIGTDIGDGPSTSAFGDFNPGNSSITQPTTPPIPDTTKSLADDPSPTPTTPNPTDKSTNSEIGDGSNSSTRSYQLPFLYFCILILLISIL